MNELEKELIDILINQLKQSNADITKRMLLNELKRLHCEYGSNDIFYINIYSTMYGYALSKDITYDMGTHTELMSMLDKGW